MSTISDDKNSQKASFKELLTLKSKFMAKKKFISIFYHSIFILWYSNKYLTILADLSFKPIFHNMNK